MLHHALSKLPDEIPLKIEGLNVIGDVTSADVPHLVGFLKKQHEGLRVLQFTGIDNANRATVYPASLPEDAFKGLLIELRISTQYYPTILPLISSFIQADCVETLIFDNVHFAPSELRELHKVLNSEALASVILCKGMESPALFKLVSAQKNIKTMSVHLTQNIELVEYIQPADQLDLLVLNFDKADVLLVTQLHPLLGGLSSHIKSVSLVHPAVPAKLLSLNSRLVSNVHAKQRILENVRLYRDADGTTYYTLPVEEEKTGSPLVFVNNIQLPERSQGLLTAIGVEHTPATAAQICANLKMSELPAVTLQALSKVRTFLSPSAKEGFRKMLMKACKSMHKSGRCYFDERKINFEDGEAAMGGKYRIDDLRRGFGCEYNRVLMSNMTLADKQRVHDLWTEVIAAGEARADYRPYVLNNFLEYTKVVPAIHPVQHIPVGVPKNANSIYSIFRSATSLIDIEQGFWWLDPKGYQKFRMSDLLEQQLSVRFQEKCGYLLARYFNWTQKEATLPAVERIWVVCDPTRFELYVSKKASQAADITRAALNELMLKHGKYVMFTYSQQDVPEEQRLVMSKQGPKKPEPFVEIDI